MGVEGLFGYLMRNRVEGAIIEYSNEEFMQKIRTYQSLVNLFNCESSYILMCLLQRK